MGERGEERERESFYFRIVWPTAFDFLARVMAERRRRSGSGKKKENKTRVRKKGRRRGAGVAG